MAHVSYLNAGGLALSLIFIAVQLGKNSACPSPPVNSTNSSTCPYRCCCNDVIQLVNCSRLFQNLPTVFPVRAKTILLDWNYMDTFDRENCSVFRQSKSLETLSATNNRIATVDTNCFRGLGNLTMLNLSNNALTSVPIGSDPYPFRTLDLRNNNIRRVNRSVFVAMPNLTTLYLDNNTITALPSGVLTEREKLKVLSMRDNGLRALQRPFTVGCNIEELYLSNNELSDLPIDWLVGALQLRILDLRNATSALDDAGKEDWKYPGFAEFLQEIDLSQNGLRSVVHSVFDSAKSIRTIDLSSNELRMLPDGLLVGLVNLTRLMAQGNELVNISSSIWGRTGSTSLEYVDLSNNQIERIDDDAFSSFGMLRYLDLSGNQLMSLAFLEVAVLSSLETLLLNSNMVRVAPSFVRLTQLRVLQAADNNISALPNVRNLSNLEEIDLSRNNISVVDLSMFQGTTNLIVFNLEGNNIVSIRGEGLKLLPRSLVWFNLVDNQLRCDCDLPLASERLSAYEWGINLGNLTCSSPPDYEGVLVINLPALSCDRSVKPKSIILLVIIIGIVIALIGLAFLCSKYRRLGLAGSRRQRSFPVEEKTAQMNSYDEPEEVDHLMGSNHRTIGNYHNLRASRDMLGTGSMVGTLAGSSSKINGSAIKPFEEEFYV